jgi:peptide/nickel transport system ATP-binding protein
MTAISPVPRSMGEATAVADGPDSLLVVDGLSTWFSTPRGLVHAVDDVSFSLPAGETLGIVGESGSGKSVLARTIMNLTPKNAYTSGEVSFRGLDLLHLDHSTARSIWGAEISMVFQDPSTALNPVLRIGHQITESLELHLRLSPKDANARAIELLDQVGIPEPARRLKMYPHELSGGMRQRVCIAIAIACRPKLLFADEPTTALDVTIQRQILDLLSDLRERNGMAMVLITHDFGVVAGRTHRLMVLYGGKVAETGSTTALFATMRHPYTTALLASIPRLDQKSHTPLAVIPGQPVDVIDPSPRCRFAGRCRHAQPRCLEEDPPLTPGPELGHAYACFYPVGTPEGDEALATNLAAGKTAAGLELGTEVFS